MRIFSLSLILRHHDHRVILLMHTCAAISSLYRTYSDTQSESKWNMPRKSMEHEVDSIDLRGIFHLLSDCVSEYVLYNDEIAAQVCMRRITR